MADQIQTCTEYTLVFRPGEFSKWQPQHEAFFTDDDDDFPTLILDENEEKLEVLIWLLEPYDNVPNTWGLKN